LNKLLKEKGFIDTTNTLLKSSYLEDLSLKATITALTYKSIWGNMLRENMFVAKMDQLLETSVNVEWKVCDYYGNEVLTEVFSVKSDHFTVGVKNSGSDKVHQNSIQDALVKSLIKLSKKPDFIKVLNDKSALEAEKELKSILLAPSEAYVNSLSEAVKSTVTVKSKNGFGSGFVIGKEGYIVTNYHVVSDTSELQVIMNDNSAHKAILVRSSKTSDLALLKIEAKNLLPFNINNTSIPELAEEVYAVGTPSAEDLSQTISKGIVSGFRMKDKNKLIQTDASVNGGNSGGPLVTKDGKVQAVVVSKVKGFGVEGIAFGIPVAEIIKRLKVTFEPVTK
jgi:serine protease Do